MKTTLPTLTTILLLAASIAILPPPRAARAADNKPPAFLKVGASYEGNVTMGPIKFTVLDLGDGNSPWIKVQVSSPAVGVRWLNTAQLFLLAEAKAEAPKSGN